MVKRIAGFCRATIRLGMSLIPMQSCAAIGRTLANRKVSAIHTAKILYESMTTHRHKHDRKAIESILADPVQRPLYFKRHKNRFYTFVFGIVLALLVALCNALYGMWFNVAMAASAVLLCMSPLIESSMACYCLKEQRIISFHQWKRCKHLWLPGNLVAILIIGFVMLSAPALAESQTMANLLDETSHGDIAAGYLDQLFGFILEGKHQETALGQMFYIFNGWLLLFASAFLGLNALIGISDATDDGRMLGAGYTKYAVIRVVMGLFMLMPLPVSYQTDDGRTLSTQGINAAQAIVIKTAQYAIGFGNAVWKATIQAIAYEGKNIVPPDIQANHNMVYGFLKAETCANIRDITEMAWLESTGIAYGQDYLPQGITRSAFLPKIYTEASLLERGKALATDKTAYNVVWDYGDLCGKITETVTVTQENGSNTVYGIDNVKYKALLYMGVGSGTYEDTAGSGLVLSGGGMLASIHNNAVTLAETLHPEGARYDSKAETTQRLAGFNTASLEEQAVLFQRHVAENMQRTANVLISEEERQFLEDAKRAGFLSAGAYYNRLAALNAKMINISQLNFDYSGAKFYHLGDLAGIEILTDGMNQLASWWETAQPYRVGHMTTHYQKDEGFVFDSIDEIKDKYDNFNIRSIFTFSFFPRLMMLDGLNPLAQIADFGHYMVNAAITAITVKLISSAVLEGVSKFFNVSSFAASASAGIAGSSSKYVDKGFDIVYPFLFMFLVAGSFLAYYLPLIPYIIWMFAMIAWFAFIVEALVAAPFWAIAHVKLSGGGVMGEAAMSGYQFLLNMFVRPPLMIMGLILGFALFQVAASIINLTFVEAIESVGDNSFLDLVGIVFYSILIVILYLRIADLTFSLIHEIPNRVTDWIGFKVRGIGDGREHSEKTQLIQGMAASQLTNASLGSIRALPKPTLKPKKKEDSDDKK